MTLSSFYTTSSGVYSMMKIWQGSMQLIVASMFCGVGQGGFKELYPIYSVTGFETAANPNALWLRLLCDVGIIGLMLFALVIFFIIQNCFEYLATSEKKEFRTFIVAGFAALIGLLVQSLFCDLFSNAFFLYAFWCLITVLCAAIRTERREVQKYVGFGDNNEVAASIEL